jgi:hypothetical protein
VHRHASAAGITVEGMLFATDSANSALFTVENFLFQKLVIKEFAHFTIIACEFYSAIVTRRFNLIDTKEVIHIS